jgi:AraC family transcriptional regulator
VQEEFGQRIELSDRRPRSLLGRTLLSSGDVWRGFRLTRLLLAPVDFPDGYLTAHFVSVQLGPPCAVEAACPGEALEQHTVAPGSMNLMPAGVPHRVRYRSPSEKLCVQILPHWFESVRAEAGMAPVSLRPRWGADEPLVAQLALALAEEVRTGYPAGPLYGEALAMSLVARIARAHAEPPARARRPRGGLLPHKLRLVVEYIDSRLEENMALQALAEVAQLNVFHFIRAFKQSTGASPHQFVLSKRIARARSLLDTTELPVAQVALECGFSNQSHFTAAFHRATGVTPALFRRGIRGAVDRTSPAFRP